MRQIILNTILVSLLLLVFLNTNAQSSVIESNQDYKHKIDIGFSDGLPIHFTLAWSDIIQSIPADVFGKVFIDEDKRYNRVENITRGLPLVVRVHYWNQVSNRIYVGAGLSYLGTTREKIYQNTSNPSDRFMVKNSYKFILIQGQFRFDYLQRERFRLYGKAGVGLMSIFYNREENRNHNHSQSTAFGPTFDINPIGLEFGKNIGGYLEVGVGVQGFIQGGMFFKF